MTSLASITDVVVGQRIPTLTVTPDRTQLFLFSAATYNAHRIHYDQQWATEEGYDDVLVQGPLLAALLARAVTDWAGPDARLTHFAVQNRAVAHPGQQLAFGGTVTAVDPVLGTVELDVSGEHDGTVLVAGTAAIRGVR